MRTRDDEGLDDADRKVLDDIESVGWHMVGVPDDAEGPGFAFSIGLFHTFKHPEIIIVGLPTQLMFELIQTIGGWAKDGRGVAAGQVRDDLLDGYACAFRPVGEAHYDEYLGYAGWFYRSTDFPVLQCVWPDREARWPWDSAFDSRLKTKQPLLD